MSRRLPLLCLAAVVLSACAQSRLEGSVALRDRVPEIERAVALPAGVPESIRAELVAQGRAGVFFRTAGNGDYISWRAPDGSGLVTLHGLLSATFGLGFDLISADVSDIAARLRDGASGDATRVHRYLDGENQILARAFMCEVTIASAPAGRRRVSETCVGADRTFENSYVLDGQGRIVTSSQWVGPEIGHIRLSRLDATGERPVVLVAGN